MAELPRATVLILDNNGKNWAHDGGCTFGPTEWQLMTHAWMQNRKLRVNTIRTQNMFAHTRTGAHFLPYIRELPAPQGWANQLWSPVSRLCTFGAPCDRPRRGGNEALAERPKPGSIHQKAALTQKPQNQSAAEGTPLFSTWANIHPKWALKGVRCVGMLTSGAERRSGGSVTLTLR